MKISFDSGLVAILRTKTESDARDMANALVNAGIKLIEFTTTTPGALNLVEEFSAKDRKSTRLNSSHIPLSRMPSSA